MNQSQHEDVMELLKLNGENFKRRGKMIRKANHGKRPCRGKRQIRMGRGHG
jgi:hypothetical protein